MLPKARRYGVSRKAPELYAGSMGAATLVSVEEYLSTSYSPDVDFLDGELRERNVGERWHSETQAILAGMIRSWRRNVPLRVFTEQRIQIKASRYRIPDLCVVLGRDDPPDIFIDPPFICIELLSKDDTGSDVMALVSDYRRIGVPHIWAIDPVKRSAWSFQEGTLQPADDLRLRTSDPELVLDLNELFAELDER